MRSFRYYPSTWFEAANVSLLIAAFFIFLYGFVLRWQTAGPMWLDELHTQWSVNCSIDQVFHRATIGNQSPLYFWANNLLNGLVTPRGLAICCSFALLISIGRIVFIWSGCWTAVVVAVLLASIDDSMIYFGIEARPYVAVQLVAVWQTHFFCRHLFDDSKNRATDVWLTLTSALLVNLHLTAAILLLVEFVFVLSFPWLRRVFNFLGNAIPWRRSVIVACVVGLMCLPAAGLAIKIAANRTDWDSVDAVRRLALFFVASALVYVTVPSLWLVSKRARTSSFLSDARTGRLKAMILVLCSIAVLSTIVILFLSASGAAPLGRLRYSIAGFTLLFPLTGLLVARVGNMSWRVASAVSVVGLAIVTNPLLAPLLDGQGTVQQRHERWREAADLVKEDGRLVLLFPNLIEDQRFSNANDPAFTTQVQQYYLFPLQAIDPIRFANGNAAIGLPIPRKGASFELPQTQLEQVRRLKGCTLIIRARTEDAERLTDEVEQWLESKIGPMNRRLLKRGTLNVIELSLKMNPLASDIVVEVEEVDNPFQIGGFCASGQMKQTGLIANLVKQLNVVFCPHVDRSPAL